MIIMFNFLIFADIKELLGELDLMWKYEEFSIRRILAMEPDARWCPAPDCG
jgi:hypothetical protein